MSDNVYSLRHVAMIVCVKTMAAGVVCVIHHIKHARYVFIYFAVEFPGKSGTRVSSKH